MRSWLAVASSMVLVLSAACTDADSDDKAPPDELAGRIVVLRENGEVETLDPDGSHTVTVTEEAGSVRRFQPIWSPVTEQIAWSQESGGGPAIVVANEQGVTATIATDSFPFYLSWSPDGRLIGALMNGATPGELDFTLHDVESGSTDVIDSGSPFYFSWSPDSDAIVAHVGGDSLLIYDESGQPSTLGATTPGYLAPAWTRGGIVFRNTDGLVMVDNADAGRVLASSDRFLNLTANPAGTRLAVQPLTGAAPDGITIGLETTTSGDLPNDVVSIVDVESGDISTASDGVALGMFWSPDGDKLMMPVIVSAEGDAEIVIWEDGETTRVGTIRLPSDLVANALQFADQYAQSWRIWDPDSSAVVFPGSIDDRRGIWVMRSGREPELIADGVWAAWSY